MPTSTGGDREKASPRKYGDYNSSTWTLSKNPNPNYTLTSLSPRINLEKNPSLIILYCGTLESKRTNLYIYLT